MKVIIDHIAAIRFYQKYPFCFSRDYYDWKITFHKNEICRRLSLVDPKELVETTELVRREFPELV